MQFVCEIDCTTKIQFYKYKLSILFIISLTSETSSAGVGIRKKCENIQCSKLHEKIGLLGRVACKG